MQSDVAINACYERFLQDVLGIIRYNNNNNIHSENVNERASNFGWVISP